MPQGTHKNKQTHASTATKNSIRVAASEGKPAEKVIIRCWEQDYELPEILAALHHYNLDTPALKSCVEWLLLTEKVVEFKLEPNAERVSEQVENIKQQVKADSPETWSAWLEKQQITEAIIIKRLNFQDQLQQLKEAIITEAALKDAFLQLKSQRDNVMFQVGKFPSVETAQEAWNQLTQQQADFTSLILSQTDVQQQGVAGLIGPVVCSQVNPEVLKRIVRLEPHEYTDPFTVNGTEFMVARLLVKQLTNSAPTVIEQLKDQLFQKWIADQVRLAKPHWLFYTGKEWHEANAVETEEETGEEGGNGLLKSLGFLFGKKGGNV